MSIACTHHFCSYPAFVSSVASTVLLRILLCVATMVRSPLQLQQLPVRQPNGYHHQNIKSVVDHSSHVSMENALISTSRSLGRKQVVSALQTTSAVSATNTRTEKAPKSVIDLTKAAIRDEPKDENLESILPFPNVLKRSQRVQRNVQRDGVLPSLPRPTRSKRKQAARSAFTTSYEEMPAVATRKRVKLKRSTATTDLDQKSVGSSVASSVSTTRQSLRLRSARQEIETDAVEPHKARRSSVRISTKTSRLREEEPSVPAVETRKRAVSMTTSTKVTRKPVSKRTGEKTTARQATRKTVKRTASTSNLRKRKQATKVVTRKKPSSLKPPRGNKTSVGRGRKPSKTTIKPVKRKPATSRSGSAAPSRNSQKKKQRRKKSTPEVVLGVPVKTLNAEECEPFALPEELISSAKKKATVPSFVPISANTKPLRCSDLKMLVPCDCTAADGCRERCLNRHLLVECTSSLCSLSNAECHNRPFTNGVFPRVSAGEVSIGVTFVCL